MNGINGSEKCDIILIGIQIKQKQIIESIGVGFEQSSSIFLDPRAITVFDDEHSENEDRWATIGIDKNGILLVVIHTFQRVDNNCIKIRIISARKATRKEVKQYQEENK